MKLTITISMDNAAFEDNPDEVARILYEFSRSTQGHAALRPGDVRTLHDINGNAVGEAIVTD